jgi:TetR/AcrR family transcriptional regulator, transcriptional repressor for nem operon
MTNSAQIGKRERLVAGAREVLHQQGVEATTIADIAAAADVPVGNVYYYFKTKDELVEAAIDSHAQTIRGALGAFSQRRTPRTRLKALVGSWIGNADMVARDGCPHGSLCSELDKRGGDLQDKGAAMLSLLIDWAEEQLRQLGRRDPREDAVSLIASFQGAALLANTLRDPNLLKTEARRLERWVDSLG